MPSAAAPKGRWHNIAEKTEMTVTDASSPERPQGISAEHMEAEKDAFNAAYGKALGAWATLEFMLQRLFTRMTGLSPEMSAALFCSARSFNGRADVIEAIIPLAEAPDHFKKLLSNLLKKIRQYSGTRNRFAHAQENSSAKLSGNGERYVILLRYPLVFLSMNSID